MKIEWPNKYKREASEIELFIFYYSQFTHGRELKIISKQEMPDYVVCDRQTKDKFGVELTSVYKDAHSVPEVHKKYKEGVIHVPYSKNELDQYVQRLIDAIRSKIKKAQKHYNQSYPLLLSVYVNEYISLYIRQRHLQKMVDENSSIFDQMSPFVEIILWPLPSSDDSPDAMSIRPEGIKVV